LVSNTVKAKTLNYEGNRIDLGGHRIEVTDKQMLSDVNEVASDWADSRAAEMVGMRRLASGRLVQNPQAQWTKKGSDARRRLVPQGTGIEVRTALF
jgi:hypothetical protein